MANFKKLLSLVIAVVMVFSMIPAVSAAGETETTTPAYQAPSKTYEADEWVEVGTGANLITQMKNNAGVNAVANAEKVMGIRLTDDITLSNETTGMKKSGTQLYIGYYKDKTSTQPAQSRAQTLVLDLNGHTLKTTEDVTLARLFGAYGGSTFTLTNGILEMNGTYSHYSPVVFFQGASKVTLDGVKVTLNDPSARPTHGGMFYMASASNTLTVINSDLIVDGGDTGSVVKGGIVNTNAGCTITLKNSNFTGGRVTGGVVSDTTHHALGGQFYLAGSAKLSAENCTFTGGECAPATYETTDDKGNIVQKKYNAYGGQIYKADSSGKTTFTNCTFTGGKAHYGAQIYFDGTSSSNKISGCTFTGGRADVGTTGRAGAIYQTGRLIIEDSTFTDGYTNGHGGAMFVTGSSPTTINNCTFDGNEAKSMGGNIAKYSTGTLTLNDVEMKNGVCGSSGGNICVANGTVILNSGTIENGTAKSYGGNVYISRDGSTKYSYGTFIMNGGDLLGGSAQYGGSLRIYHGRFILNDGYVGSGTVTGTGPSIQIYGSSIADADYDSSNTVTATYSDSFYMFGGKVDGIIGQTAAKTEICGGQIGTDVSNVITTEHVTQSAEKNAEGYYVVTHNNTDGTDNDVAATCTEAGKINVTCADCTFTHNDVTYGGTFSYVDPATGHTEVIDEAVDATCTETGLTEGKHCGVCGEILVAQETVAAAGHAWDEGVIDPKPTCNDAGVKTFTCGTCGETKTEAVEATGHTPVIDEAVAPDCTNTGLTEGSHCEVCGTVIVAQEEIASTGHSYTGVYTEPTFEADGYTTYTCSVCGDSYTETDEGTKLNAVAQIGDTKFETLQAAINAAAEGETVTLLIDLTIESDLNNAAKGLFNIAADDKIVIDLNGKTINVTDKSTGNLIVFYSYGDLTVKNGNVNLTAVNDRAWNAQSTIILNRGGNLTVDSGSYIHNGGTAMAITVDNSGNSFGAAMLTVNDGEIRSTYTAIRNRMADPSLNGEPGNDVADIVVNGGTIYGGSRGIWGQITNASSAELGSLAVLGGTIEGGNQAIRIDTDTHANVDVTVSGGLIKGAIAGEGADFAITGGIFTVSVAEELCAEGYIPTENGDGTYGVKTGKYVARVNGVSYESVNDAIEAAQANETVTLLGDVVLTEQLTVSKALTLDLNGFDIIGNVAGAYGMIYVGVKGNLSVVSNAAVAAYSTEGSEITNTAGYAIGNYGTVSVDNVVLTGADAALYNFYYNASTYGKATLGENASANIIWNSGELTVNGVAEYINNSGELTVNGTASEIYAQDGSDAAEVPGAGTVTIADTSAVTVPEGYKLVETETAGVYKVTKLTPPNATVTEQEAMTLLPGEYSIFNGSLIDGTELCPLEIVVNFKAEDTLEECLAGGYSDWLVDFNITFTGLENGSITADNCYLAGNYGTFGWIVIPTDGLVLENGVTYPVVGAYDASLNYKDICNSVKEFIAAIHIDQAILDANPNLQVELDLVMTNPENAEEKLYVGETIAYTAEELKNIEVALPEAEVTPMGKVTLEDGSYRVWNGVVSDKESEALVTGEGELPLEVVVNFKAIDTLEECLAGGYAQWLVDFNITVEGLENGSFTADNCYLAGNYGSYGWIKIPLDGQTIEEGIAYPVVALYDNTLNYKDICKSVKDFTAAIHIDQAILDANPNMTVKLELVMTNPTNANNTLQIGEDLIYGFDELKNGVVAQNKETGKLYTDLAVALGESEDQTVILLSDVTTENSIAANFGTTLDLNGYTLKVEKFSADVDSHVVDSTNGKGLLTVNSTFTLSEKNAAIPVLTADGYRFTSLEFVTRAKAKDGYKLFGAYFDGEVGTDATSMLATQLADGGADNNLTVRVKLTYTSLDGSTSGNAVFNFSDELVKKYAANWEKSDFRVNVRGTEKVANLQAALEIVSEVGDVTVVYSSEGYDLSK